MNAFRTFLLGFTLSAFAVGCGGQAESGTDSNSNWLKRCATDADCGSLQCLCGMCTRACDGDAQCLPAGSEAACVDTDALDCDDGASGQVCALEDSGGDDDADDDMPGDDTPDDDVPDDDMPDDDDPASCAELDEAACEAAAECSPISGAPLSEPFCREEDGFAGCGPVERACDEAFTYATDPDGRCWEFNNGCLPEDFSYEDGCFDGQDGTAEPCDQSGLPPLKPGSGDPLSCEDLADYTGAEPSMGFTVTNNTDRTLYIADDMPTCGPTLLFELSDADGTELPYSNYCSSTCEQLQDGVAGCPAICLATEAIELQPGQTWTTQWSGLYFVERDLPASCSPEPGIDTCLQLVAAEDEQFTITVRANDSISCENSPEPVCEPCVEQDGACRVSWAYGDGTWYEASASGSPADGAILNLSLEEPAP